MSKGALFGNACVRVTRKAVMSLADLTRPDLRPLTYLSGLLCSGRVEVVKHGRPQRLPERGSRRARVVYS